MSIWTDPAEEELDPTSTLDLLFIGDALLFKVGRVTVEDVNVLRVDIDVAEEMLVHEGVVGFGVFTGDGDVFVLLEGKCQVGVLVGLCKGSFAPC